MLPESIDKLEQIRKSCKAMVKERAAISSGSVVMVPFRFPVPVPVPVPFPVPGADIAMLLELIPAINRKFGLTPDQIDELDPKHRALIIAMIKKIGTDLAGKVITKQLVLVALKKVGVRMAAKQVLKYIPLVGQEVAAALSFSAMMYVGNSHVDECFDIAKGAIDK